MSGVLRALRNGQSISTGQLHKQLFPREQMARNNFELLLGALAGAGLVYLEDSVFEKDGRSINFRKVALTRDGEDVDEGFLATLRLKDGSETTPLFEAPRAKRSKAGEAEAATEEPPLTGPAAELWEKLRVWRIEEAQRLGVKAFHILGNRTLREVVLRSPRTLNELLSVPGIGPSKAQKFGEAICRVCSEQ